MSAPRVAWVAGVGATEGIGASVATRFAAEGFVVAVTGRRRETLAAAVAAIEADGGRAVAVVADLADEGDLLRAAAAVEGLGSLAVGVYNAGNNSRASLLDMPSAQFEATWRVVCMGAFLAGREMIRSMLRTGGGTLIFTGATASLRGRPNYAAFASAKAGMRMVSQAFAREFGPRGIHVAHAIIDGKVVGAAEAGMTGASIADAYWALHSQAPGAWSQEIDLRAAEEPF